MKALPDTRVEQAITGYFEALSGRRLEQWLKLFDPDCVCHDPVGSPPAEGAQGLQEIWRVITGPFSHLAIGADEIFYGGSGAAVKWSARGTGVNSKTTEFEGISVFELGPDGKILTVMSYWDAAEMMIRLAGEDEEEPFG